MNDPSTTQLLKDIVIVLGANTLTTLGAIGLAATATLGLFWEEKITEISEEVEDEESVWLHNKSWSEKINAYASCSCVDK